MAISVTTGAMERNDLRERAKGLAHEDGADELLHAIGHNEEITAGVFRFELTPAAVKFVEREAPDLIGRLGFPGPAGDRPYGLTLGMIAARCRRAGSVERIDYNAGVELAIVFESGDELVVLAGDGSDTSTTLELGWRPRPERPSETAMRLSEAAR